jgi:cell division protein FtsQ
MIRNINFRKVLLMVLWCCIAAGSLFVLGFVNEKQQSLRCKTVNIEINDDVPHEFINEQEVRELISKNGKPAGKPLATINTSLLEKIILSNPFVKRAEVYSTVDGELNVKVWQRDPVLRVINMHDEQFYIDTDGNFMPVSDNYTTPVIVANGYIFNSYSEMKIDRQTPGAQDSAAIPRIINQVYALVQYIMADSFLTANTEQVYVNEQQELEIIPRIGQQRIIFGDTTDMSGKFNRLMVFYKEGLSKTGWNNYNTINLKYRDQVVCTKIKS